MKVSSKTSPQNQLNIYYNNSSLFEYFWLLFLYWFVCKAFCSVVIFFVFMVKKSIMVRITMSQKAPFIKVLYWLWIWVFITLADHHQALHRNHQGHQASVLAHLLHHHQEVDQGFIQDQSLLLSLLWRVDGQDKCHHHQDRNCVSNVCLSLCICVCQLICACLNVWFA